MGFPRAIVPLLLQENLFRRLLLDFFSRKSGNFTEKKKENWLSTGVEIRSRQLGANGT